MEKSLGISGKQDIERFGIETFNARCRESVLRHVDEFTEMTRRMGYWVDMDAAYWTMDADYIQSVWWSLRRIFDAGLLVQDHRVAPYCPRCGTALSSHEVAQGFPVDDAMVAEFRGMLEQMKVKIEEDAWQKDQAFIRAMMHYEIDLDLFGVEAARKNLVNVDPQLQYAVGLFPEAQQLLDMGRRGPSVRAAR